MAVVVIIGILSALVGPGIIHRVIETRITACRTQLDTLSASLRQFELDVGRLPEESEGLAALLQPPSSVAQDAWHGPYLDSDVVPKDPWKTEYRYRAPGEHRVEFDLWSPGPDRQDGTEDDIGNWTPKADAQ